MIAKRRKMDMGRQGSADGRAFCCAPCPASDQQAQYGFTLVEMITIIVILGIIALVAVPRFADNGVFRNQAAADQVRAALRYAQKMAIASHSPVTVNVSAGTPANCGIAVADGVLDCVVDNNVVVSPATVIFDFMGRPGAGATVTVDGTITITIEAETGYVH